MNKACLLLSSGFLALFLYSPNDENINSLTAPMGEKLPFFEMAETLCPVPTFTPVSTPTSIPIPNIEYLGKGKVSWFGGPDDNYHERIQSCALYTKKKVGDLDPNDNYCAMRWDYKKTPARVLRKSTIIIEYNGTRVEANPIDWGPGRRYRHRIIDVSPGLMKELGVKTDKHTVKVWIQFPEDDILKKGSHD